MIILCNALLPFHRVHAIPADISKTFKSIPVIKRVKEVDFASIIKIMSTVSNIVFRVF